MEARLQNARSDNVNDLALALQPFAPKIRAAESVLFCFFHLPIVFDKSENAFWKWL